LLKFLAKIGFLREGTAKDAKNNAWATEESMEKCWEKGTAEGADFSPAISVSCTR
jgi:hypothetical protein